MYFILFLLAISLKCALNEECGRTNDINSAIGIYVENDQKLELICLGTIIKDNAILTAAHCFCDILGLLRNNAFYIATRNLNRFYQLNQINQQIKKISKNDIFLHRDFRGITNLFLYDLAIIKIEKGYFAETLKPVCIDWDNSITQDTDVRKQPIWSKNKVKIVDKTYLDNENCKGIAPKNFQILITDEKVCVQTKEIRERQENNGAGIFLLNPDDNLWYITGVISRHDPEIGQLSTMTQINQNLNWISNICAKF